MCVDYRELNKKIIRDRYPLPVMEDVLERCSDAKFFTTLDLKNGFFHVDMHEDSTKYTSFVTPDGQYEFLKVPFGLCNSPSTFQRFINMVFCKLIRENVMWVYMDDIIIPSKDEYENLDKIKKVFFVAANNGIKFQFQKCNFIRKKVEFLGHILENGTVKPSDGKTRAIQNLK